MPGILLGVGLAYLSLAYRVYFPIYGTVIIIAVAHTISWIAYGTRTTNGVMIQVHREFEEAGKVAGRVVVTGVGEDRFAAGGERYVQQLDLDQHARLSRSDHGVDPLHAQ